MPVHVILHFARSDGMPKPCPPFSWGRDELSILLRATKVMAECFRRHQYLFRFKGLIRITLFFYLDIWREHSGSLIDVCSMLDSSAYRKLNILSISNVIAFSLY